jgi:hypothetical protein
MHAPRSMDEMRVWMTMGRGLPLPAPEYSTTVFFWCDVVLRKLYFMYPHHPCSFVLKTESAARLARQDRKTAPGQNGVASCARS